MANIKKDLSSTLGKLETSLNTVLVKKAPALPASLKNILVQIAPFFALLSVLVALPILSTLLGLDLLLAPLSFWGRSYRHFSFGLLLSLAVVILQLLAVPGLFKRSLKGWRFLFYAQLVMAVDYLVHLNLGGLIIGVVLGLYLLFQIKSYYK